MAIRESVAMLAAHDIFLSKLVEVMMIILRPSMPFAADWNRRFLDSDF
jgi:hypothetical protein